MMDIYIYIYNDEYGFLTILLFTRLLLRNLN